MPTNRKETAYLLVRYGLGVEGDLEQHEVEAVALTRAGLEDHCRASGIVLDSDVERINTFRATPETFWFVIEDAPLV